MYTGMSPNSTVHFQGAPLTKTSPTLRKMIPKGRCPAVVAELDSALDSVHTPSENAASRDFSTRVFPKLKSKMTVNKPFARSGHMVQNKLCWNANNAVGLPKQQNSYQSSPTFLCLKVPLCYLPQHNLFRTT